METLFSILQWALPGGGLGVAIGWLLSKNIRKTREAKEIHDTYKTMYRDVQSTLLDLQAQNDELVKTMARFKRAVYRASVCRYWPQCPVRNELRQQKNGTSGGGFDGANIRQPRRDRKQGDDPDIRSPGDGEDEHIAVEPEVATPLGDV